MHRLTASWLMLQGAARTMHDSTSAALEIFNGRAVRTHAAAQGLTTCVSINAALESFNGRAVRTHAAASEITTGVSTYAAVADWSSEFIGVCI